MLSWRLGSHSGPSAYSVEPRCQQYRAHCYSRWAFRQRSRRARQKAVPALALSKGEAYRLLGADQGCSRAELRAAYMIRIRQVLLVSMCTFECSVWQENLFKLGMHLSPSFAAYCNRTALPQATRHPVGFFQHLLYAGAMMSADVKPVARTEEDNQLLICKNLLHYLA